MQAVLCNGLGDMLAGQKKEYGNDKNPSHTICNIAIWRIVVNMLILVLLFILLAGLARAAHTARKDYHLAAVFARWAMPGWWDRYIGDNSRFNPAWPWTSDFWHAMVHAQVIAWALAVYMASFADLAVWDPVIAWWLEGLGFKLGYHRLFIADKKIQQYRSWWKLILTIVWPFTNWHNGKDLNG